MKIEIDKLAKIFLIASIIFCFSAVLGTIKTVKDLAGDNSLLEVSPVPQATTESYIKDETAGWKTYRNEEYGFELKYPENLNVEEKTDSAFKSFSVFLKGDWLNGYILINNPGVGTGFGIEVSSEDILIDGMNLKLEILDSSVDSERAAIVSFTKNTNDFFWLFRFNREETDKLSLVKKIISTFKFAEKIGTTEWKIYTNNKYGFEIKYPSDIIKIFQKDGYINLVHSIPFEHENPCDFKDDAPTLKDLTDFDIDIEIVNLSLIDSVREKESEIMENYIVGDSMKIEDGYIEKVKIAQMDGYRISHSFEGCGNVVYYFSVGSGKTLYIRRYDVAELTLNPERYSNAKGIIMPQEAEVMFATIISTFKFTQK